MLPLLLSLSLLILASLRLLYILRRVGESPRTNVSPKPTPSCPHRPGAHLLISLGSGGHTAEMLALLSNPPLPTSRYTRRTYVISSGDAFSAERAREFEAWLVTQQKAGATDGEEVTKKEEEESQQADNSSYEIHVVPRARRIHQPLLTAPVSCLACLWSCIRLLLGQRRRPAPPPPSRGADNNNNSSSIITRSSLSSSSSPDLILLNGPATSLILVLASIMIRYFAFLPAKYSWGRDRRGEMRTVYVESWARVKTPSLTLRIISWAGLCDRVVVQHRPLEEKGWGEFRGDIMC